ncbi:hypothetical protein L3X39_06295 [Sabulilitoribacter multivorans]|uniref:Fibronectin type-III domain-containing protein n=1 Tax=Flaviramulus multivorans TaxID=1304750 RepID=A0ABS9IHK7_9FLAO|nr:hypothetical protein [Flaviramulus multivorans]MCF7560244.1 hypothetical protein [Flaviramulus multivorans]
MKHVLVIICLGFLVFGCSKSSVDDTNPDGENPGDGGIDVTDKAVALYFPQKNMLCNEGTNLTPTESTVFFEWRANDSENYKITIENLSTGEIIQDETTTDIIPIVIKRATAYKWFVESTKGGTAHKSEVWQFYNAGPGVQSYAPFPAVIVAPNMAESLPTTSSVTLQWTADDVDDDIVGYDIYFSTDATPSIFSADVAATELNVSTASNTIYYWKVITKDSFGNTSDSGIHQFKVL